VVVIYMLEFLPRHLKYLAKSAALMGFMSISQLVSAAQATLPVAFDVAAERIEPALESAGLTLMERADTERFALFFAEADNQQSITITVFALPKQLDRVTVTVNSAAPADISVNHQLMQAIRAEILRE